MPYREKRIKSGKFLEVEIYPISKKQQKTPRAKKLKESSIEQKKLNEKNSKKHCVRLVHHNFSDDDIVMHPTYDEDNYPLSYEDAVKNLNNFIRRYRTLCKKRGIKDLKYIAVTEYYRPEPGDKRKKIRIHHHIIISGKGIDRDEADALWGFGISNANRLKAKRKTGYEGIVKYMLKDPKGARRWKQSRNILQPIIEINDNKYNKKMVEAIAAERFDVTKFLEEEYLGYRFADLRAIQNKETDLIYLEVKMTKEGELKSMKTDYKKLIADLLIARAAGRKEAIGEDIGDINLDTLAIIIPKANKNKIMEAVKIAGLTATGPHEYMGKRYFISPPKCGQRSSRQRAVQAMYRIMLKCGWEVAVHSENEPQLER